MRCRGRWGGGRQLVGCRNCCNVLCCNESGVIESILWTYMGGMYQHRFTVALTAGGVGKKYRNSKYSPTCPLLMDMD